MPRSKKTETKPEVKKPEKLQAPRGTRDFLPVDHAYFTLIKKVVRHRARQAGFRRISTPTLEDKNLFLRAVGDDSDIAAKELYTLTTQGGTELALKPEGTAGVVRAYIENGMSSDPQPVELYYIESHYRHDRPQRGRYRQFRQFGFEVIGEPDAGVDAQIIQTAHLIHSDLRIADQLELKVNTIGCPADREKYIEQLKNYYIGKERNLCEHCVKRLETNPLRLLDCKEEDCKILATMAPKLAVELCEECQDHHSKVCQLLEAVGIEFENDEKLVRGLDYYTRTVFEFVDRSGLSVGGGGRYDGLVEQLGGTPTPACGYAGGIERIIELMQAKRLQVPDKDQVQVFVAQLGFEAKLEAMKIITQLREAGVHTLGALGKASMKAQLNKADKFGADYALILGEVEVREGKIILRDMKKGKQEIIPLGSAVKSVIKKIGPDNLDFYDPSEDITEADDYDPAKELLDKDSGDPDDVL